MNDKRVRTIYAGLLGLMIFTIIAGAASAYFTSPVSSSRIEDGQNLVNTIIVTGTGTVYMPPDEALVYLGVQTTSDDVKDAQKSNAEKMEQIIKALKEAGIKEDDIETSSYSLYPLKEYYYGMYPIDEMPRDQTGYVVSNQLQVKVKDFNRVGDIIDVAVEAGANQVNGVSFTLSEQTQQKGREQALKNAVKAARDDADILASALGVRITGPVQASTGGGTYYAPMPYPAMMEGSAGTPIQPGDVSVSAYVTITYQFV